MTEASVLSALRRTRQYREFTDRPVADDDLREILNVARWTGSGGNAQEWRFHVIRDPAMRGRLAELVSNARHVGRAAVVIAIAMPGEKQIIEAFDEGRVAERILVAAEALGLGAGIGWATGEARQAVSELLGVAPPGYVRTLISIGHPTAEVLASRSPRGEARKPLSELVVER
jgi:nitroreductase